MKCRTGDCRHVDERQGEESEIIWFQPNSMIHLNRPETASSLGRAVDHNPRSFETEVDAHTQRNLCAAIPLVLLDCQALTCNPSIVLVVRVVSKVETRSPQTMCQVDRLGAASLEGHRSISFTLRFPSKFLDMMGVFG